MKTYAILLASGTGSRFGGDTPKQFVKICGKYVIEYTIEVCVETPEIDEIVIVVSGPYVEFMNGIIARRRFEKPIRVVIGGATRKDSCMLGVAALLDEDAKVIIHNAVQPFVLRKTFEDCIAALDKYDAVSVGSPCVYTILELDEKRLLRRIVPRARSVNDLGPECFKLKFLLSVFARSQNDNGQTNLTGLVLKNNFGNVYVVEGDPNNIKITYKDDLVVAQKIIEARREKLILGDPHD